MTREVMHAKVGSVYSKALGRHGEVNRLQEGRQPPTASVTAVKVSSDRSLFYWFKISPLFRFSVVPTRPHSWVVVRLRPSFVRFGKKKQFTARYDESYRYAQTA